MHSNWNAIWLVHLDSVRQLQNVVSYYPTIYNRLTKWWVWLVYEYSSPLFVVMRCVAVEYEHRNRIATSYIWTTPLSGSSLWDYTWMDNVRLQFNIANHGIIHGITERNGWCDDYNKYIQCDVQRFWPFGCCVGRSWVLIRRSFLPCQETAVRF